MNSNNCEKPTVTAEATARGYAFTSTGNIVTSTATATATGNTYEEAYAAAYKEAKKTADIVAQNDANIITQSFEVVYSTGILPNENTRFGLQALSSIDLSFAYPVSFSNSAFGYQALNSTTQGSSNSAFGCQALYNNIGENVDDPSNPLGVENNAFGAKALFSNTTGSENVAIGSSSLYSNTSGLNNVSVGNGSLYFNTTGNYNTAIGDISLYSNTTGNNNTALGEGTLLLSTTGSNNTVCGFNAFETNLTGSNNTVIGYLSGVGTGGEPGYYDNYCTLIGGETSFSPARPPAPSSYEYSTAIGYGAVIADSHKIYLGTKDEQTVAVGGLFTPILNVAGQNQGGSPYVITSTTNISIYSYKYYTVQMGHDNQSIELPTVTADILGRIYEFVIVGGFNFIIKSSSTLYNKNTPREIQPTISVDPSTTYTISFIALVAPPVTPSADSTYTTSYAWFQM